MDLDREARERLAAEIARAVEDRLGGVLQKTRDQKTRDTPGKGQDIGQVIVEEVALAFGDPGGSALLGEAARQQTGEPAERIVVAANGRNRAGVVARLTAAIDEFSGDIRDISQTIVGEYFTMIIVVDISGATRQGAHFASLRERLRHAGQELGVHVVVLHDDILSSMHTI